MRTKQSRLVNGGEAVRRPRRRVSTETRAPSPHVSPPPPPQACASLRVFLCLCVRHVSASDYVFVGVCGSVLLLSEFV